MATKRTVSQLADKACLAYDRFDIAEFEEAFDALTAIVHSDTTRTVVWRIAATALDACDELNSARALRLAGYVDDAIRSEYSAAHTLNTIAHVADKATRR